MPLNSTRIQAFADELEKIAVDIDMPLLTTLLGGGGAAYAAHKMTRDPRYKTRNALLAAIPGLLGGRYLGKGLFPNQPGIEEYGQQIAGGYQGLRATAADIEKQRQLLGTVIERLPIPRGIPGAVP